MALEIIDIRQFGAQDFKPLLETETRVWAANLRWDFTASAQLISNCLQEKRLPGYALLNGNRIEGYSFFFYEGEKGLIGDLFVEPASIKVDHALLLLEHVVDTLIGTPGIRRVEAQLPHFSFDQLEPCFHLRYFEGYRRRFMLAPLRDGGRGGRPFSGDQSCGAPGAPPLPSDFQIELWQRKHDRQAAQLLARTYRNHIDAIINDQYRSLAGSSRLLENILLHRGCGESLPEASLVAFHRSTQKLAGILALTEVRPRTAHIPQVAVAREFQGTGLGTAMLERAFQELARQGYLEVSLTVTDLNAAAVRLYERLGFETFHTFGAFVWNRDRLEKLESEG